MIKFQRRIVLTGFMGAGKTTVAAAIARRLDCRMIDLDALIAERERQGIAAIIDRNGEARFRELETRALYETLHDEEVRLIALGGGTWTIESNRAVLAEHNCLTVWLDSPFEACWDRITRDDGERPLARDKEEARRLFQARQEFYRLCDLRVNASPFKSAAEVAGEIISYVLAPE